MPKQKKQNKLVLGVTGIFGSGKSTVARMFKVLGAEIIDADKLAHACLQPGDICYRKIQALFGTVERKKLARLVFNDAKLLQRLNSIIHPQVIHVILERIKRTKAKVIVLDAPLLIECGLNKMVDKLIVVSITGKEQLSRLKKVGFNRSEVSERLKAQIPLGVKLRIADFIIDNSGTLKETKRQVSEIAQQMLPRRGR
ncbi:MAG: dephospho-CoA kinase [Candidatus Omnitrophica bacterium]|nr:dephospho-CoA kinase [Candidatus Omnitrophota bacterium]